jgi:FixJ family two-component response regulator
MPLALLLSPDDQAVAAITSVLEEMSVTCDRPLDGASAAQKLNSDRFDLVLVDCENLPAAKLIFDVCRNRKGSGRPVPVAVVDGRAGLPTAFRLGAELILTKPVAKDQARVTIRTAISRVKREESSKTDTGASSQNATTLTSSDSATPATTVHAVDPQTDESADYVATEGRAFAVAAAACAPASLSDSDPVPVSSAPIPSMSMSATAAEPERAHDTLRAGFRTSGDASTLTTASESTSLAVAGKDLDENKQTSSSDQARAKSSKSGNDPAAGAETGTALSSTFAEEKTASPENTPAERKPDTKSKQKSAQKSGGRLLALFALLLVCGGFYGAWMYEPGFQPLVKGQINRLLVLVGVAPQQRPASQSLSRPVSQTPKPSAGVPLQTLAPAAGQPALADPNAPLGTASVASPSAAVTTAPPSASAASSLPATPVHPNSSTPSTGTPAQAGATTQPGTIQTKPGVTRINLSPSAVQHPASVTGAKSSTSSATKSPDPQQ